MPSAASPTSISDLIAAHRPGCALERGFYVREDVFEQDMEMLLGRWSCVGHASEVRHPGDWLTAEIGAESAIVVRGEDGVLRALNNVCRHRGSRVCVERRGAAAILTCPYHAWTYHLDGRLRRAREMPADFDPAGHGLLALPLSEIGGLIFISFDADPPSLDIAQPALAAMTAFYGWENAKVAERRFYSVAANWKLVMENYHECYHCAPTHPQFSALHALARPGGRHLRSEGEPNPGVADFEAWSPTPDRREVARVMRSPLAGDSVTGSADGKLLAPLMNPGAVDQGACVFAELGLLSAFLAYPDYGVIYRFIPRGVLETGMEVIWLVDGDAREGADYDLGRLTWLWDVTSQADKRIIETNQAGVRSRAYRPGPFSPMEPGALAYVERYVSELARLIEGGG
ncbi:MAG: aromatic ring-hydroxylating oxygenase subunit alpha [Caulobacteraceae bacterium]